MESFASFIATNSSIFSLLLTIIGWYIIITNTRFLGRRTEAQDLFKLLREFINKAYIEYEACIQKDAAKGTLSQPSAARLHAAISDIEAANLNLRTYYETGIDTKAIYNLRIIALHDTYGAKPGSGGQPDSPIATFDQRIVNFRNATSQMNYTLFNKNYKFLKEYRLRVHTKHKFLSFLTAGKYNKTWPQND